MIANALKKSSGINYPGLIAAWSAKGKTNDDEDRAILKDLTGNGHDITLNGFAFSEMSGYGGYKTNMLNWKYNKNSAIILSSANKFIMYNTTEIATHFWDYVSSPPLGTVHRPSFKLKISGLNEDEVIYSMYYDGEDFSVRHEINLYNGINIFPEINAEIVTEKLPYNTVFEINSERILNKEITFEILPEYPDALVFDGVDDYGQSIDRIKALTKYTIILKRKIIKATNGGCVLYKGDLRYDDSTENFGVEFTDNKYWYYYSGLLGNNKIIPYQEDIIYAKEKSYNGQQMNSNLDNVADNPIVISTVNKTGFVNMAFYSAYLFDRSLDEQEIKAFIRKYIDPDYYLPSEVVTPDCYYDFSQGSNDDETRDTIKDLSGNGNDAVAHNFAWSGMSGYGGYNLPIEKYIINGTFSGPIRQYGYDFKDGKSIGKLRFNVSNLSEGTHFSIRIAGLDYSYKINKNGYWELKDITNNTGNTKTWEIVATGYTYNNVTIEFLPEYEGALVFDGIDDHVSLDAFDSGFKTIFMVCTFFSPDLFIYDQRNNTRDNENAVTSNNGELCYYGRNKSGITYINGLLNDYKYGHENSIYPVNTKGKKHLITCAIINGVNTTTPTIANRYDKGYQYLKMNLYKFLGFKEALTEEQIQAIIKKYNLLDGVDEIEIS